MLVSEIAHVALGAGPCSPGRRRTVALCSPACERRAASQESAAIMAHLAHASPDHDRYLRLFLRWQRWSCPLGAHPPGRALRTALDHQVIWFLDDTNFNISSVSHLHRPKESRRWYFYNDKHLHNQLLKGANGFGSQFEKWQNDQWLKLSRTE